MFNKKIISLMAVLIIQFAVMSNNSIIAQDPPPIDQEESEGGELPGAEISCSAGSSGRCFYIFPVRPFNHPCPFDCVFSGVQTDYCSRVLIIFLNFCQPFVI